MKKFLPVPLLLATLTIYAQKPNNFLQPEVWLRADKISDETTIWEDQSKNGYDAVPENDSALSSKSTINFNKAITLNGEDSKLNIPINLSSTSQLTILTVYNSKGTLDERAIWGATINPGQDVLLSTQKITGPQSIVKYSEGNMNLPVVNTSSQYWGKAGEGVDGASLYIGGAANTDLNAFSGDIAEFIVFDRLVEGAELQMMQSYLSLKYGATFQYSNYVSSKGKVYWNYLDNEEYSFAIAGIGRDEGFDLYQKQSSNVEVPELLTIAANAIAPSNDANLTTIGNGNFLVWGMNEKEPTMQLSKAEIYPYTYPIMERKWKMEVTGKDAKAIPTELQFNVKDIIGEATKCYLAIDRTGTGDFASKNVVYIQAENITENGIATFKNILWDEDKSGADVFSLSFGMDNGVSCTQPICHNEATGAVHMQIMGGAAPYSFALTNEAIGYKKEWTGESRFQDIENLEPGNYRLVVTDKDNNMAQNTVTINNPGEFSTGLEQEYTLKMGESLGLNASKYISGREATFKWKSENGFYSTDVEIYVTQPGEYTLTITNKSGCVATETLSVKAENDIFYNYSMYPNPSRGDYKLDISLAEPSDVTVRIYASQGAMISEERGEGAAGYTFRGHLDKTGLYLVDIETSFGKETFKLIVNN